MDIRERIRDAITSGSITIAAVKDNTLVSALNDYHVFQDENDRVYSRILKEAMDNGIVENIVFHHVSYEERDRLVDGFIAGSGYDANKTRLIINSVCDAFNQ